MTSSSGQASSPWMPSRRVIFARLTVGKASYAMQRSKAGDSDCLKSSRSKLMFIVTCCSSCCVWMLNRFLIGLLRRLATAHALSAAPCEVTQHQMGKATRDKSPLGCSCRHHCKMSLREAVVEGHVRSLPNRPPRSRYSCKCKVASRKRSSSWPKNMGSRLSLAQTKASCIHMGSGRPSSADVSIRGSKTAADFTVSSQNLNCFKVIEV